LKELNNSLVQSIEEAEKRRKAASAINENYKVEFSEGEKHAYEEVSKTLKTALSKI
jgi:F0F1-type ATP synthase membrane subunit b/b'